MSTIKNTLLYIVLFLGLHSVSAQTENPVISAIQKEVDRNKKELKMEGVASAFFISYMVFDRYDYSLSASLGSISSASEYRRRQGVPTLLVGDYHRNNLNVAASGGMFFPGLTTLTDNSGISLTIWRDLDGIYKTSVERYKAKMAILQQQTQTKEEQALPDFEQVKPVNIVLQPAPIDVNKTYWENYLRKASEIAKQYPDILSSSVSLSARNIMAYTYNTEGSRFAAPTTVYQLIFTANTRADDGQELTNTIFVENATFQQMPDLTTFTNRCKMVMENLLQLKKAPVMDDAYFGPVLFENEAAFRIFLNAFLSNNRLAASQKLVQPQQQNPMMMMPNQFQIQGGNDFELMLNKKVISRDITIKSITGQEFYKGQRLNGYYPVDAEGVVPDKELALIENGVLRNMLNGRRPTKRIGQSNGHFRYDYNNYSFSVMPGNILITSSKTFSNEELRKKLIAAAKEEDLEYAYIVRAMEGSALYLIYRIFVDDGREELLRGATISDAANIRAFKRILGVSDKEIIASYGSSVQSTVILPNAILFEEMDVARTPNIEFKKPYIVPKPN